MIIPVGATVQITKRGHFMCGKKVVVTSYPDIPELTLVGQLLAFEHPDYFGKIGEHVISSEWCEFVSGPTQVTQHDQLSLFAE